MDIRDTPTQEKQITIAVPEDRVPEFYAFYGRFLAGGLRGGRGRRGARGHGRCGHRTEERTAEAQPATEAPAS
jgi:hypothetical protein